MKSSRNACILRLTAAGVLVLTLATGGWAALEWKDIAAGSTVEAALYRLMPMPVSRVLGLRPPREAVPLVGELIAKQPGEAELYSLRALNEEAALDFPAAEADWKKHAELASDKMRGQLALADFYHRRLRPADEVAALGVVGRAPASDAEKLLAPAQQRSWQAFERVLKVIGDNALPAQVSRETYRAWIGRYPSEIRLYARYFQFLLDTKAYAEAGQLIAEYRKAFPNDEVFPVKARALLAYRQGSVEQGLAIYDAQFQPLWPQELVDSYFGLMTETRTLRKFLDGARATLERNPDDLNAAARIFYYYQRQGQSDAAAQALTDFRARKDMRNAKWTSEELYTLARLSEGIHANSEAARYYYALYNSTGRADAQELALAGLANLLLDAPEQGIRLGAGELSMYRDIGTIDAGPGFLNGILSLVLNTSEPSFQYSEEEQRAVSYFHRAEAAQSTRLLDAHFPKSARRPEIHARLISTYALYGESEAVIRDGQQFLAAFHSAPQREEVALHMADAFARTHREQEEFALYDSLLAELAAKADRVPLGIQAAQTGAYEMEERTAVEEGEGEQGDNEAAIRARLQARAFELGQRKTESGSSVRSPEYSRVLERYLSRLVATNQVPQALTVLRKEIDRNPNDPGLYERLAQFLQQNRLGAQQEEVYQRAIQQFQDRSWYHKLARFYLREKRTADYERLTAQVVKIFSGTELEDYLANASGEYYVRVLEYAHNRFPHDLVFVRGLLGAYKEYTPRWEQLLREHWWEGEDLRNRFFEFLSRTGRLDEELAALQRAEPAAQQARWPEFAATNPVATRFLAEAEFWRSHFEPAAPLMGALAQQFPADAEIGRRASAVYRSLAAFDPRNTELAVAIENRLYEAAPGERETLARIGDIYADRELFSRAAPYWERMAQVRPGEPQAYLDAATVYWDYYDFDSALRLLNEGRVKLGRPALYTYEEGAIYEGKREYAPAIAEYLKGALAEGGGGAQARMRLLALARRPKLRDAVDQATAALGAGAAPTIEQVKLRLDVLEAQNRPKDLERYLLTVGQRTTSLEMLEWLEERAREKSLVAVQQNVLERQAAVTTDPIRRLELRYALVRFFEDKKDLDSAQRNVEALYRDNPKILGVVRATADFYWRNRQQARAVEVLLQAADAAYPALRTQFQFEAARKSTEVGQYAQARQLLTKLLADAPYNDEYLAAMADTYARAGDDQGLKTFYLAKIEEFRKAPLPQDARTREIAGLRRGLIPALTRLKDYAGAVDQYIEIVNKYPEDGTLVSEAALYAQHHALQPKLLDFYRNTMRQSPRDYRWPTVLARMLTQLEAYPAAIDAYAVAMNIRPDRVDLRGAHAELLERLMRFEEAAADYQRLSELNYHATTWMEKVAELRARQGHTAETIAALQTALIENRPEKPENYFEVARRLESWGMLPQAREFAEKGVSAAGRDLLAISEHHAGAALYARIMTRLRQQDTAFQRLQAALGDATSLSASVGVAVQQVERSGLGSVTDQQWRERELGMRRDAARTGMTAALRSMGAAARQYFTPEEKVALAGWVEGKARSSNTSDLDAFFLPLAESAELADLEARWDEQLMLANYNLRGGMYKTHLVQLQARRMRFAEVGRSLERYAQTFRPEQRDAVLLEAAQAYRSGADYDDELRVLSSIRGRLYGDQQERLFDLLLHRRPQELLQWAASSYPAAQYAILHGDASLAMQAVSARGRDLPPVWNHAYSALTGLYFGDSMPTIQAQFVSALGDATVRERIGKEVDRNQQIAGSTWFYYGSRYGEWLGLSRAGDPEDFLPAILEQSPASASGYITVAEYYADAGKLDRAIQDYAHTLELAPGRADIHDRIALLYWRQQKRAEAVGKWKQALEMLDAQVNQRSVPASFWPTIGYVLNHVGNRKVLADVRPQADRVLRDYVRYNGSYQADNLLHQAFAATGDPQAGAAWMLELAAVAPNPPEILSLLLDVSWFPAAARDPVYQQLIARLQQRVGENQGLSQEYAQQDLMRWQIQYARYLVERRQFDRAAAALQELPSHERPSAEELELRFRIALARGEFDAMLAQYRSLPEQAPPPDTLRQAARALQQAKERAAARKLLEFVFVQEITAHQLTPANMLGLAEIRLQDGDDAGALELLRRLTLVVGQPFENLEAAASLLARSGHHAEAAGFLAQLIKAQPWNTAARGRLAQEQIAAGGTDQQAARTLAAEVARDRVAAYDDRVAAAAIAGAGSLGSDELDLIARGTVSAEAADRPYFYPARVKAASGATPDVRGRLLQNALNDTPERDADRPALFYALVALGRDQLAIAAIGPMGNTYLYDGRPSYYQRSEPETPTESEPEAAEERASADATALQETTEPGRMSAAARRALNLAIGKAYARLEDYPAALRYFELAASGPEKDPEAQRNIAAVQATVRRIANNTERAPMLHAELEQEHVVRPRLVARVAPPTKTPARALNQGGRAQ